MTVTGWIVAAAAFAVAAVVFFLLGIRYRKRVAEKEISSAEEEATRIINEAAATIQPVTVTVHSSYVVMGCMGRHKMCHRK